MVQAKKYNFNNLKLLYLRTSFEESMLNFFTQNIRIYTSGMTLSSILHLDNYDALYLEMKHKESFEVLESLKQFLPNRYIVACCSDAQMIKKSLMCGADSILMDDMDKKECEKNLYKVASYNNLEKVFEQSFYEDILTKYKNSKALKEALLFKSQGALVKISLDSFKAFQIYYGIDITNKVLVEFGNAIALNLPVNAELFRSNDDEFSILLKNPSPSQEAILASQIKAFFEQTPIEVDGFLLKIRANIGMAHGKDLLQKVDIALSEAKEIGNIAAYNENSIFLKEQKEHIEWVKVIQEAISEDRVIVHFQAIMDNSSKAIDKYEVLCRIEDKDKKTLHQPYSFIPSAISAGRMADLTRIIIDKSMKFFKNNDFSFAINITREDFMGEYLVEFISYKCDYYDIKPERIYIEILENISTEATKGFLTQIQELKALGCNISIDDFGVDSSNFARMMQIKAEILKIDGHFIQHLLDDDNAKIIVENIVEFSKKIGAQTVAEYVDTQELHALVTDMGIDYSQGFYIGKPSPTL